MICLSIKLLHIRQEHIVKEEYIQHQQSAEHCVWTGSTINIMKILRNKFIELKHFYWKSWLSFSIPSLSFILRLPRRLEYSAPSNFYIVKLSLSILLCSISCLIMQQNNDSEPLSKFYAIECSRKRAHNFHNFRVL